MLSRQVAHILSQQSVYVHRHITLDVVLLMYVFGTWFYACPAPFVVGPFSAARRWFCSYCYVVEGALRIPSEDNGRVVLSGVGDTSAQVSRIRAAFCRSVSCQIHDRVANLVAFRLFSLLSGPSPFLSCRGRYNEFLSSPVLYPLFNEWNTVVAVSFRADAKRPHSTRAFTSSQLRSQQVHVLCGPDPWCQSGGAVG